MGCACSSTSKEAKRQDRLEYVEARARRGTTAPSRRPRARGGRARRGVRFRERVSREAGIAKRTLSPDGRTTRPGHEDQLAGRPRRAADRPRSRRRRRGAGRVSSAGPSGQDRRRSLSEFAAGGRRGGARRAADRPQSQRPRSSDAHRPRARRDRTRVVAAAALPRADGAGRPRRAADRPQSRRPRSSDVRGPVGTGPASRRTASAARAPRADAAAAPTAPRPPPTAPGPRTKQAPGRRPPRLYRSPWRAATRRCTTSTWT